MGNRGVRGALLAGWFLLLPPSTWKWRNCEVVWDEAAPISKWAPRSESFATLAECEARRAEVVRREAAYKPRALARAHEVEAQDPFIIRLWGRLLFDASTSAVCVAMADEWSHTRCEYVEDK